MPRRSKRVKISRGATNNVGEQRDDDNHDGTYDSDMDVPSADTSDFEEPRPKRLARKKTASARARPRRAGKLRQMLDMPLDVILEICAYLQPKDILNLSRASKDLRKFFLNRNSASIWKTAISSFPNLPACPKDLSEPAYVDLMFGTHCHACAKKNCKDVYWLSRVRLCDECRKAHEVSKMLDAHSRDMIKPYELTELVPPIRYLDKWDESEQPLFYGPELDEFLENLNKTSASNRREFLWKRKVLIDTREYGKNELAKFLRMLRDSRTNELEKQRDARRSAIVARLREAGHGEDIDYLLNEYRGDERRQFIMMPEVRKTQRLTEKSWNNMKDKILRFIENVGEIRLKAARKATTLQRLGEMDRLVKEVVSTLRGHRPCTAEIVYRLPEVAQVIDPLYDGFDVQELGRVLSESVPVYAKNREEQLREEFRAFIVDLLGLDAETDPYNLAAVMWYSCSCCSRILNFDSVLHHICEGEHRTGNGPPGTMSKEVYSNFAEWAWYARGQHVSESAWWKYSQGIKAAAELIEKAGLDPKKATVDDIDNANVRIVQLGNQYYSTVTSWRVALLHAYKGRLYNYRRATEAETSAAKPLEAIAEARDERGPRSGYQCSRCDDLDLTTKDVVVQHLEEIHGITRPTDRDCIDRWPGSLPHIEVYLFCPERASTHAEWLVKDALEKGIGAYFDGWDDEAVTL